jgi:hypothetical protein
MKGVKLELNQNRIVLPSRNIAGAMQESRFVSDGFAISFPYGGRRMQECERLYLKRVARKITKFNISKNSNL